MGSGSSVIACHILGLDIWACEIDHSHFDDAQQRINAYTSQGDLFPAKELIKDYPALFEEAE
jgi:DNA modification methylase